VSPCLLRSGQQLEGRSRRWATLRLSQGSSDKAPNCGSQCRRCGPMPSSVRSPANALMLFVCTFDVIFELTPIVRELFGHFVGPAWHIPTDCRRKIYDLTNPKFVRGHHQASHGGNAEEAIMKHRPTRSYPSAC
jgi:hypothetical protein